MKAVRSLRQVQRVVRRRLRLAHGALADRPRLTLAVVFPLAWMAMSIVLTRWEPAHWSWGAVPALALSWLILREPGATSPRNWS
jgi:hypothetical protein